MNDPVAARGGPPPPSTDPLGGVDLHLLRRHCWAGAGFAPDLAERFIDAVEGLRKRGGKLETENARLAARVAELEARDG